MNISKFLRTLLAALLLASAGLASTAVLVGCDDDDAEIEVEDDRELKVDDDAEIEIDD